MTIEELFGTLQQSVIAVWRKHLRTAKYSKHIALNDFYEEMPEKVDDLIEAWMGVNGRKIKGYDNILQSKNMNTLAYLKELRRVVKQGYELMNNEPDLNAKLDDIIELIDSTLYKVKELNEHNIMNLKDFISESLVNESISKKRAIKIISDLYNSDGDLVSVASCWNWLEELDWEKLNERGYAKQIVQINDDIDFDFAEAMYGECMMAMADMGRTETYNIIKNLVHDDSEMEDYDITL